PPSGITKRSLACSTSKTAVRGRKVIHELDGPLTPLSCESSAAPCLPPATNVDLESQEPKDPDSPADGYCPACRRPMVRERSQTPARTAYVWYCSRCSMWWSFALWPEPSITLGDD